MRTLAIDLGTRRVGLALSDEGARFATPFEVLLVSSPKQALSEVLSIVKTEGVERLAIGVPLNMDGTVGPAARSAIAWGRELALAAGKPLILLDERLSSFEADQSLSERKRGGEKLTRKDRKHRLDAIAAASFLQAYLDDRIPALDLPEIEGRK